MSSHDHVRRQQLLREAEGYLDLIMVFADQWPPRAETRDRLARRALEILKDVEQSGAEVAYAWYLQGQALRAMELFRDALVPLRASADGDSTNIHVWLALGWCYKRIRRIDLAIESLEEALAVDSSEAIIHYNLACYWSLSRNANQALYYLSTALDIDPNYRELVEDEADFDPIRSNDDFRMLTSVIV